MQTSRAPDKTKRRIRIVVNNDGAGDGASYTNLCSSNAAPPGTTTTTAFTTTSHAEYDEEVKRLNIDDSDEFAWEREKDVLILSDRNKNDKNWENWERIREQKLEKMKNICFESYRQSKRDNLVQVKPKPKQLDPTWYTDNIYSNRSDDLDEDYVPDCLKYGTYPYRTFRDIQDKDDKYAPDGTFVGMRERRGEGEGSPCYNLQRSKSCKEFHYPKSQSLCFEGKAFESIGGRTAGVPPPTTSILKNRAGVPKSYSFSASTKTMPFDIIDYKLPPQTSNTRREKREAHRRNMNMNMLYSNSLDENTLSHSCCVREQCTSAKCLLDDIYPCTTQRGWRRAPAQQHMYGSRTSDGSNRQAHHRDWLFDDHRMLGAAAADSANYALHSSRESGQRLAPTTVPTPLPLQSTVVCCCAAEECCCHHQQEPRHVPKSRSRVFVSCPNHHPAAEEEEHMHMHCHCHYGTELEHFIREERERLMMQDKFLEEDERYLSTTPGLEVNRQYTASYSRPARSKSLLEVQPPSLYDEDTCSDTTEIDLEDFNIDLEKYWEELDKPPSPINVNMQRHNIYSNLKVKNVNVRCYNNGQPIDLHDREHERLMIKKSLLEGMPSPPQLESSGSSNNASSFPFFENASVSMHHPPTYGLQHQYGHKIYPTADTLPSYQYNNFYPEHTIGNVLTQQPTVGGHHTSAGGHSALSLINNIFSIYKPNKYSPENCQVNYETKPEPCKKMNVPSTRRPLGASHADYMHSMKRPLIIGAEQPHFKIVPEKTGLKITPLLMYDEYDKSQAHHRLSSTARPLMLPH